LTVTADNTPALVKATPRGDFTLARASRTCCCVTLKAYLSWNRYSVVKATHRAIP
jgi:hypothetical protein